MPEHFDLCVIGGGPAGYAAVIRALDFGKKVILVEKHKVGGAGVFNGALSSKTLWEIAKDVNRINRSKRGYRVDQYQIDYQSIIETMHEAENDRSTQMILQLKYFENHPQFQFRFLQGFARFLSPTQIAIDSSSGSEIVEAQYTILATGTRPRTLPHIPVDEQTIVTSDGITSFPEFPESLVILGAGVIGCEFATIFSNFKKTKVYLIDKADRILPFEDPDISEIIARNFEQNGVTIHRNTSLDSMTIENGRVKYVLNCQDGSQEIHYAEKALMSIGRVPNVEGMGLEEIGLKQLDRGGFPSDDTSTNLPNIFVVGDLTGEVCLVNVGELEGRHAVEKIFAKSERKLTYNNVSTIMFLEPEVAGVGLNETQAMRAGIPYRVACYGYEYIPRALAMRNTDGFFKILVTDDDEMRILGMRAMGPQASSSIQAVALLISMNKGIEELAELIHPHPSIVEGVQECVRMLMGKSIIKPGIFESHLKCSRVVDGKCYDYLYA
jgi:dihydrolipoamide dehydrogenase